MSQTVGIITMAKHEHDFINPWIEYHYKLGFNHFYILVDNIGYKQSEYIIDEKYKKNVSLIYVDDDDIIKYYPDFGKEDFELYIKTLNAILSKAKQASLLHGDHM